jgi:hypothetical protein
MPDFPTLLATAGVSRVWLAQATGYSRSAVDSWCSGERRPPGGIVAWLQKRAEDQPPKRETGR